MQAGYTVGISESQFCILGLNGNLFLILWNIPTVVGMIHRGHGCKWEIYAQLIVTNIYIYTKRSVVEWWWEKII